MRMHPMWREPQQHAGLTRKTEMLWSLAKRTPRQMRSCSLKTSTDLRKTHHRSKMLDIRLRNRFNPCPRLNTSKCTRSLPNPPATGMSGCLQLYPFPAAQDSGNEREPRPRNGSGSMKEHILPNLKHKQATPAALQILLPTHSQCRGPAALVQS